MNTAPIRLDRSYLRESCQKCGGRFHYGQQIITDFKRQYHLSCYAKVTREGTHKIGESFRGKKNAGMGERTADNA